MVLKIILTLLCFIALCCIIVFIYKIKNITEEDNKLKEKNLQIREENQFLHNINDSLYIRRKTLESETKDLTDKKETLMKEYSNITTSLTEMRNEISYQRMDAEKGAQEAFSRYVETLDESYKAAEKTYDGLIKQLEAVYEKKQDELLKEKDLAQKELDILRSTRQATIAAQLKEEEIKKQLDFYCLGVSPTDFQDIKKLEAIKPTLNKPRILSMLIWSTYFQKEMTTLCNNILGTKTITGIYKITNQQNSKCYIGQSVDVAKRWKDHAKCGLGIDTPAGNKLYKDMQATGIWNFSWELLEECPKEQLDEKEKYYIDLYQSKDYGYNTTKGNN